MRGEVVRSCSCAGFCPCVVSLGEGPLPAGGCRSWSVFRIDAGHHGEVDLSGLKAMLVMDVPGRMNDGNWTTWLALDRRAGIYASKALLRIFTGKEGGSAAPLSRLVGSFLGAQPARISYEVQDRARAIRVADMVDAEVAPIPGRDSGKDTVIVNSEYWLSSEIVVARSTRSILRGHGRNWDFSARSAEIGRLEWRGP